MDFTTTIPANTYFAPTKAEANALARDALNKQAVRLRACCDTPDAFGCVGQAFTYSATVILGKAPFQWSLIWGSIPPGCVIRLTDEGRTMIIEGTPTTAGNLLGVFTMLDGNGTLLTKSVQFFIVGITDDTLPAAQVGVAYSHQLTAVGGSGSYYFQLTGGTLPAGLSLSSTGLISGTPTTAATSSFQISLTDQAKDSPVTAILNSTLLPVTLISDAVFGSHSFQMPDFATLFANPPAIVNHPVPQHPVWNGQMGVAAGVTGAAYQGVGNMSKFPNGMWGPWIDVFACDSGGNPVSLNEPIAFWKMTIAGAHFDGTLPIDPAAIVTWPIIWEGAYVTHSTNLAGTYVQTGGSMSIPSVNITPAP